MAESLVQVTSGAGPKLHTWQRTIGANNVEDEFVIPGEYPLASYSIAPAAPLATTNANAHLLQIMAGASLNVRVRRIRVRQHAVPAAVAAFEIQIWRLSSAGTGGTAITPSKMDTADAAAGATAMTLPTAKGTETVQLWDESIWLGVVATPVSSNLMEWVAAPGSKGILIPAGATNGIAVKNINNGTATLSVTADIVETSFV